MKTKTRIFKRTGFKFKTFSKKQKQILTWWCKDSPVRESDGIIANGAIRSGKTVSMGLSFVLWAMSTFDGENLAMCGKTIGAFRRNVWFWLKLILVFRGYGVDEIRNENLIIISKDNKENYFYIFGGKDERSQDLIQGITLAGIFLDEVALMPESFVKQATARCSVDGSKYFFNCNPDGPFHWFNLEWIEKHKEKNILLLHFTMDDNLSLSEKVKKRYEKMYTGLFYKRFILGLWVLADGIIYDMFDMEKHVVETVDRDYIEYYVSCDYGTFNACCFGLYGRLDKTWYKIKEYYYDGRTTGKQKTDEEYTEDLIEFVGDLKVKGVIVDPSASSFITTLKNRGKYTILKAKNDVLEGIKEYAKALNNNILFFNDCCKNSFREFSAYIWDVKASERGEDKPLKQNDHCLVGDTIVNTLKGDFKIKDLVGKHGDVFCYDERKQKSTVSFFYDVKKTRENVEVFEILTEDGRTITATADHRILTTKGWKELKDIVNGDFIIDIRG